MSPDLSSAVTNATWHSFQKHANETAPPVLPRVNIDSSAPTSVRDTSGLHRRTTIDAINQSPFRRLIPKCLRLHFGLKNNERQIDTCRNGFKPYGAEDNPLVTYEHNKVLFRTIESSTNNKLGVPISRHSNRRYNVLKGNLEEQTRKIKTLLTENLICATKSFSSIGCLLDFVNSELSEFISLPDTLKSLQASMKTLFYQDPHTGNAETLQLIHKLTLTIEQRIGRQHSDSLFCRSLRSGMNDMTVEILCSRLSSLNSMQSLIDFVGDHSCHILKLSGADHTVLIKHMISRIDLLAKEMVSAELLFSLDNKLQLVCNDRTQIILKKAFSVELNEINSLDSARTAYLRANEFKLRSDDIISRLFKKMCSLMTNFEDALDTFNKVTASTTNINRGSLKTLKDKVVTIADSADHFYQLTQNPAFHKDISMFCLNGLAKDPNHIQLKELHAKIIEKKILEQFDKAADRSRINFDFKSQSQIDRIIRSQENKYQKQFNDKITSSKNLSNTNHQFAADQFDRAEKHFKRISSKTDSHQTNFVACFDQAVKSALNAMMTAPTESMRKKSEDLINSYFKKKYTMKNGRIKSFTIPTGLAATIKKIKTLQTIESNFLERKKTAIKKLKKSLETQKFNKTCEFNINIRQKKEELNSSLQLLKPKLHSQYSNLFEMKSKDRYFLVDNFCMPYLYYGLFFNHQSLLNMDDEYRFDLDDASGNILPSTFTENISVADSGFLANIDAGDISFDTSLPFDMNYDLNTDLAVACDLTADLTSGMNFPTNFGSDITNGCDFSSSESSYGSRSYGGSSYGGSSHGGSFSGDDYDGGGFCGGGDGCDGGGCDGGGF